MVREINTQFKKAPDFVDGDSKDLDNKNEEEDPIKKVKFTDLAEQKHQSVQILLKQTQSTRH